MMALDYRSRKKPAVLEAAGFYYIFFIGSAEIIV